MWAKENYEILKNNCNGIDTYLIALSKRKVRETERFSFTYAVHLGISIGVSVLGIEIGVVNIVIERPIY